MEEQVFILTLDLDVLAAALQEKLEPRSAPPVLSLGWAYLSRRYRDKGVDWLERIRNSDGIKWDLNSLFNLACGLPRAAEAWDKLEKWDVHLPALYWQRVPINYLAVHDRDLRRACAELARTGRFLQAVNLAGIYSRVSRDADGKPTATNFDPEVVVQSLKGAAGQGLEGGWFPPPPGSIGSSIEGLLDHLENAGVEPQRLAELEWIWFSLIHAHGQRASRSLKRLLAELPEKFVGMLKLAFRRRGGPAPERVDGDQKRLAENAFQLLHDWDQMPGSLIPPNGTGGREFPFPSGNVNGEALQGWIEKARKLAAGAGRAEVADNYIGRVLAHSPMDADGTWPCLPVRQIIETEGFDEIGKAFSTGLLERRGSYMVDGGKTEQILADKFSEMAKRVGVCGAFPKTIAILNGVAEFYTRESKREKDRVAFEEFEGHA